ncbi:MAG: hypothetical protein COA71_11950 [SAR86 cluster bacterium]|uniref:Uncharacterized protein n=1 Tax=SAR86 cluster bacterium TaxID=2030880 RepID=A0A2A5C8J8_9GAMM|nr:hypothetical protein [Gammaproteobacteria bacterium AH-315-E17]PCJ40214.1 MAG: hypothetical protein COA71_11950 [SAR86 cluster bacterium]
MHLKLVFTLIGFILLSINVSAQVMPFPAFDEASQDSDFLNFRTEFIQAIEANDTKFIFKNSIDDVMNGFGGSGGLAELADFWEQISPNLLSVLKQGGYFSPQDWLEADVEAQYTAPYTDRYPQEPNDWPTTIDWIFSTGAITNNAAEVVDVPGGRIMETLGQVIVVVSDWWPDTNPDNIDNPLWVEIELADGRKGNISASQINSPVGYRCFFEKRAGKWFFAGWAAGD